MNPNTHATEDVMERGRRMGGQAMARAGERAREWSSNVQDLASRGMSSVADTASEYGQVTRRYVVDHPVKSALMAAAVGAAVAGVIMAMRYRRRSSTFY